ncbi:MAG: hypothetical protein PWQ50_328 [Methanolobus sp.]|nr:hypothetical protein [Methanolobus sp.]
MKRSRNERRKQIYEDEEQNPLTGVANLFDIAMVFSVALLVDMSENKGTGTGEYLGSAYRLPDGTIVYVPNDGNSTGV